MGRDLPEIFDERVFKTSPIKKLGEKFRKLKKNNPQITHLRHLRTKNAPSPQELEGGYSGTI